MEPVGIVGLVASSVTLASRALAAAKELDDFIKSYRAADKSVSRLANQLRVFAGTVDELDDLLDGDAIVSGRLKGSIQSSLQDCDDVLRELEEHIKRVVSRSKNDKGLAFTSKLRLLWSQGAVGKEAESLHMQFQTLLLLTSCVCQKDHKKQDGRLSQPSSKKTIAKSVEDARSVRERRDNRSIISSTMSTRSSDKNIDAMLSIDEELVKSGPYVEHYRAMFMKSMKGSGSAAPVPHPAEAKDDPPPRRQVHEERRKTIQEAPVKELPELLPASAEIKPVPSQYPQLRSESPMLISLEGELELWGPEMSTVQPTVAPAVIQPVPSQYPQLRSESPMLISLEGELGLWGPEMSTVQPTVAPAVIQPVLSQPPQSPSQTKPDLDDPYLKELLQKSFSPGLFELPQPFKGTTITFTGGHPPEPFSEPHHSRDKDLDELCQACEEGNLKWATYLVKEKIQDSARLEWIGVNFNGKTPLHLAVESGHKDIVAFLLQAGVNPDVLDVKNRTPLLYAMERVINDKAPLDITKCLIEAEAYITHLSTVSSNLRGAPLTIAVAVGHFALAELLLKAPGATYWYHNIIYSDETTPLYTAVANGRLSFVKLLLAYGCYADHNDANDRSALVLAIISGRRDIVRCLVDHHTISPSGVNLLSCAVKRVLDSDSGDDLEIAKMLIDAGLAGSAQAPDGCPLVYMAVAAGHVELYKLLANLEGAFSESFRRWNGRSTLRLAVARQNLELASLLVRDALCEIDDENDITGVSPLLLAVRKGNANLVSTLLETQHKPLDYHKCCDYSVLATACCTGMESSVKQLLDWGLPAYGQSCKTLEIDSCDSSSIGRNSEALEIFRTINLKLFEALHIAVRFSPPMTSALIAAGAHISRTAACVIQNLDDSSTQVEGVTPLHLAIGPSAELLITQRNANVFAKDSRGRTPLFWAVTEVTKEDTNENLLAVVANLDHGSPVNIRDNDGHTPLAALALRISQWAPKRRSQNPWVWDSTHPDGRTFPWEQYARIALEIVKRGAKVDIPIGNDSNVSIKNMFNDTAKERAVQGHLKLKYWKLFEKKIGIE